MEKIKPQVLLAMHDSFYDRLYTRIFENEGYEVVKPQRIEDMLEKMGIPEGAAPDLQPTNPFKWYIMDVNYGSVGESTIKPAKKIYQHVEHLTKQKKAYFMSLTGNSEAYEKAIDTGIPCLLKKKENTRKLVDMIKDS